MNLADYVTKNNLVNFPKSLLYKKNAKLQVNKYYNFYVNVKNPQQQQQMNNNNNYNNNNSNEMANYKLSSAGIPRA